MNEASDEQGGSISGSTRTSTELDKALTLIDNWARDGKLRIIPECLTPAERADRFRDRLLIALIINSQEIVGESLPNPEFIVQYATRVASLAYPNPQPITV